MSRLSRILRTSVAAICIAATGAPVGSLAQSERPVPRQGALEIRVGQASDFSRIEFHWAGGARAATRRDGQTLILRFDRNATPDLAMLKTFPPRWLAGVEQRRAGGGFELVLTLAEGADARVGQVDGVTFVNLFQAQAVAAAPPAQTPLVAVPEIGSVRVEARTDEAKAVLNFDWPETVAAAVFRRGDSVWAVFDARADLDLSALPRVTPQFSGVEAIKGPTWTAVRIRSPVSIPLAATAEGSSWRISLGEGPTLERTLVGIARDTEAEMPALSAAVAGATRAIRIEDAEVGAAFIAVTALAPSKGLDQRRRYADLEFAPTAQGLVIEPRATDLSVSVEGDIVRLGRPRGLALSSPSAVTGSIALADGPRASEYPGLIDFANWSKLDDHGFYHRYDALMDAAMTEAFADEGQSGAPQVQARMALARFLVASELAHEAIGVLNMLGEDREQMLSDPEFRALRGAARVLAGRYAEASVDFSAASLASDPAAALWRGYIAVQIEDWAAARREFARGYSALAQNAPVWRARFARADAEAALNTGELDVARSQLRFAERINVNDEENLATSLMRARLFEVEGEVDRALEIYDLVTAAPRQDLSTAAQFYATRLRLNERKIQPTEAAAIFDGLRFRWRGDATEIKTIRALGKLYLDLGRYRQAMEALRSASLVGGSSPEAIALNADLSNAFRDLFLEGKADGLQPIQAVGLFMDFQELAPVGAEGDRMVRLMARRLVDVDLLENAAVFLKYQADNRLEGVAKADVATELALVYLMDRKPEQALQAINDSRISVLPNSMNSQRRLVSARALMQLGRHDAAVEMIELERTPEAEDLRAEIAWARRDWAVAGPAYERRLGERWRNEAPLTADEEARLMRAAISFSLGGDEAALTRMSERYGRFIDGSRAPEALRVALTGVDNARLTPADLRRVMTQGDTFAGWVTRTKQRFRERAGDPARQAASPAPAQG